MYATGVSAARRNTGYWGEGNQLPGTVGQTPDYFQGQRSEASEAWWRNWAANDYYDAKNYSTPQPSLYSAEENAAAYKNELALWERARTENPEWFKANERFYNEVILGYGGGKGGKRTGRAGELVGAQDPDVAHPEKGRGSQPRVADEEMALTGPRKRRRSLATAGMLTEEKTSGQRATLGAY
jgi:hypothetical protein